MEDVLTDRALEDELAEVPVRDRVFKILVAGALAIALVSIGQVLNLGIFKGNFYEDRALANMSSVVIKPAPRGIIKDRFGASLVQNEAAVNVYLDSNALPKEVDERDKVLARVGAAIGLPEATLREMVRNFDWDRSPRMLLKEDISHEELLAISSLNLPGLTLAEGLRRSYGEPLAYSHILGYVGLADKTDLEENPNLTVEDVVGKSGLEAIYDDRLRGINGKEIFLQRAEDGEREQVASQKAVVGRDLETFIDGPLQEFLYRRLEAEIKNLGRRSGAGLAVNPQNGEVLALVSYPGFDGSRVADFLNQADQPLFNRIVSGLYNPGSTIKPLVALAALVEGIIEPTKQIYSAGYLEIPNPYNPAQPSRFLDWRPHGWVDVYSALARSSNVYFYEVGGGFGEQIGLGIERLKEWWRKFGLADPTGIDLPGESAGFLPDPQWKEEKTGQPWRLGDTYNVSIGQGDLTVTPLELLNYISAIANGGKFYQLRVAATNPPRLLGDWSGDLADVLPAVRRGMEEAVSQPYGTANFLGDLPIRVAAKTGTAQIQNNEKINAFFVGYAPAENPQLAVLVLVEDAREGSLNTVPIAKDVFLWYYTNRLQ